MSRPKGICRYFAALASRTQPQQSLIRHLTGLAIRGPRVRGPARKPRRGAAHAPYEDAVAERIKGMLKDEFGVGDTLPGFAQADALVVRSVRTYCDLCPHGSCDFLTPSQAHEQEGRLVRRWTNYCQLAAMPAPT